MWKVVKNLCGRSVSILNGSVSSGGRKSYEIRPVRNRPVTSNAVVRRWFSIWILLPREEYTWALIRLQVYVNKSISCAYKYILFFLFYIITRLLACKVFGASIFSQAIIYWKHCLIREMCKQFIDKIIDFIYKIAILSLLKSKWLIKSLDKTIRFKLKLYYSDAMDDI